MPNEVGSKLQVEASMSVPNVLNIQHEGKNFAFNGWVGNHNLSAAIVFEFVDEEDVTHIWVDVNGNFICQETQS